MDESDYAYYLAPSDDDLKWRLVCTDTGRSNVTPDSPYPPRMSDHPAEYRSVSAGRQLAEFQIVYLLKGRGTLRLKHTEIQVEAGDLFLLFPGVSHSYNPDVETGWTETWVGFKGPYADALRRSGVIDAKRCIYHPGIRATLLGRFSAISRLAMLRQPLFQYQISAEILGILAEVIAQDRLPKQLNSSEEIVERVNAFLAENLQSRFDLVDLSRAMHQSRDTLTKAFKSYTGTTPYQYVLNLKINKAKELLASADASVKEVAWKVGLDDPLYFSRLFKKKTGKTPSQWMAEHQSGTRS